MMERRTRLMLVGMASLSGLLGTEGHGAAQYLPFELPPVIPNQAVTIYDVPNVPDANGCVKMCFRDSSPCDPPSYKHADNRCRNVN